MERAGMNAEATTAPLAHKGHATIAGVKVLVLAGGKSAERDVSLATGAAVAGALHTSGAEVFALDPGVSSRVIAWTPELAREQIGTEPPEETAGAKSALAPSDLALKELKAVDVVFIALHGGDGENGRLQALLDMSGIAYTGSGMLASALAMDKHAAKRIFVAEGIPTPDWRVLDTFDDLPYDEAVEALGTPLIVKPNAQGSTVGLTLVERKSQWPDAVDEAFRWDGRVLVEQFISGRELTVGVLGNQALPVVEIKPRHGLYDYECKYTDGMCEYLCPAPISPAQMRACQDQGLEAFRALGCRGYARADFRMDNDGRVFCLEVNTLPGMTSHSLVPKAAKAAGIDFPDLVARICRLAI
jgi:D-alanine-D-alanine ligase